MNVLVKSHICELEDKQTTFILTLILVSPTLTTCVYCILVDYYFSNLQKLKKIYHTVLFLHSHRENKIFQIRRFSEALFTPIKIYVLCTHLYYHQTLGAMGIIFGSCTLNYFTEVVIIKGIWLQQ